MVYGATQSLIEYIIELQIYFYRNILMLVFELAETPLAMLYLPQIGLWAAPLVTNAAMLKKKPHILEACGDGLLPWQQGKDAPRIKKVPYKGCYK